MATPGALPDANDRSVDTPRTDAAEVCGSRFSDWGIGPSGFVEVDFARSLERELAEAHIALKAAGETAVSKLARAHITKLMEENEALGKSISDVTSDRDGLRETAQRACSEVVRVGPGNDNLLNCSLPMRDAYKRVEQYAMDVRDAWETFQGDFLSAADYDEAHGGAWIISESRYEAARRKMNAALAKNNGGTGEVRTFPAAGTDEGPSNGHPSSAPTPSDDALTEHFHGSESAWKPAAPFREGCIMRTCTDWSGCCFPINCRTTPPVSANNLEE